MSWSYDSSALEKALNWVRFRIGDTDTDDQQLSDEEIGALLAFYDDRYLAAADSARAIAAKFGLRGGAKEQEALLALASAIQAEGKPEYL